MVDYEDDHWETLFMKNTFGLLGACLCGVFLSCVPALSQMQGHHGQIHQHHKHDMLRMPGLHGRDTTAEEVADMARMFRNFSSLSRQVTLLSNGIRTETTSTEPILRDALLRHVIGMIDRVETGRDPEVRIQSPTLDIIFAKRAKLDTQIDITDTGIVVIQTSEDADLVTALHTHAAEVSDMVKRGMHAVHEAMAQRAQSHLHRLPSKTNPKEMNSDR
jgi:hypothetical protein